MTTTETRLNHILSDVRTLVMGIAMLMVMLYHSSFCIMPNADFIFKIYGVWGVDIFLFASGFGIYHSLKKMHKNEDLSKNNIQSFYKQRIIRIMPATLIAGILGYSFFHFGKLALTGLHLWYIRTILIYYLLSPFIYKLLNRHNPQRILVSGILITAVFGLITTPIFNSFLFKSLITWSFLRFPSFILGMYLAKVDWNAKKFLSPVTITVLVCIFSLGVYMRYEQQAVKSDLLLHHLWPIPVAFSIPLFCALIHFAKKIIIPDKISKCIEFFGIFSLEIYVVHEMLFHKVSQMHMDNELKFLIGYGSSIVLAVMLHYTAKRLLSLHKLLLIKYVKHQ